ncbi:MAG: hypothetical protein ACW97Z_16655 [Candidatus Hodarchaeales archaeon]
MSGIATYPLVKEARYDNPVSFVTKVERHSIENPRTLVTLCSYIPEGLMTSYVSRSHRSPTDLCYSQNRLECLKFVLACYQHWNAGASYDFILIDNDSSSRRALDYFKTLDITVMSRENTYYSFGAYKTAWDHFGKDYDYFVFHEMDWTPSHHGWLRQLIDIWESDPEIGMVGNLIEDRKWTRHPKTQEDCASNEFITKVNKNRLLHYNLDSEYLFTDKTVLSQMDDIGWLLFKCRPEIDQSPAYNELAFQQPILEMGYKLRCFNDGKHTMFYGTYNHDIPAKWNRGFENLAPFIPEQVRLFMPEYRKYFNFYNHDPALKSTKIWTLSK